jgi:(E)-2-((N-methylformamido)methylene)succinate hydrolase
MQISFALPDSITSGKTSNGTAWSRIGSGKTLVLLHGVGMNKSVWAPEVNLLSNSFDVLVYDMWGHGDSDLPEGELTLGNYTNQLADLLRELKISNAFIAGHSMGGLIAIDFALAYPEICLGMCALNAVFNRTDAQSEAVKKRAADLAAGGITVNLEDTLQRWFGGAESHEFLEAEKLAKELLLAVNAMGYAKAYQVFANSDKVHADRLATLSVPALFFTADGDPNSTPDMSKAMALLAPLGSSQVLTGHRHMMTLTAPLQVSESLATFFNSASKSTSNQ